MLYFRGPPVCLPIILGECPGLSRPVVLLFKILEDTRKEAEVVHW